MMSSPFSRSLEVAEAELEGHSPAAKSTRRVTASGL